MPDDKILVFETNISCTAFENLSLCKKCPYSELFWSVFSPIWIESEEISSTPPYSVQTRENTEQNNSKYEYFTSSVSDKERLKLSETTQVLYSLLNRFVWWSFTVNQKKKKRIKKIKTK